ncbi:MAG: hypothetical protein QXV60_00660 [Nitrososphaerota archaeon]
MSVNISSKNILISTVLFSLEEHDRKKTKNPSDNKILFHKMPKEAKGSIKKVSLELINQYVEYTGSTMKLSSLEKEQMKETIHLGLINNSFGNIIIENNAIVSIDGLLWDVDNRVFYIDARIKSSKSTKNKKSIRTTYNKKELTPQFITKWERYLDSLYRKAIKRHLLKEEVINCEMTSSSSYDTLSDE